MTIETQVLVVGAGPGGYVAAIKLGKLGKKVLLVDKDKLGGECLNYGCIPSKALIHAAGQLHTAKKSGPYGLNADALTLDWAKVQAWKTQMIAGFVRGIAGLEKGNKVDVLAGEATLTGPNSATVKTAAGVEEIRFENALLVTGTRPLAIPGFAFDGKTILSSKEALELPRAPDRLVVIGGGVIGLEIGTFYAKLGSKVSVVEFLPQVLPGIDGDFVAPVLRSLQKLGVDVYLKSKAKSAATESAGLAVTIETPEGDKVLEADKVLLSVGRAPITKGLGLEAAGIETDAKGHIKVDAELRTSCPSIFAAGDVIGPPYLAHKASREGILAALAICGFSREERGAVPWAVFTDPEISFVGETEAEARARGIEVAVGRFPFSASGRAQAVREPEGFCKVIADKQTHRILGAGFVGPHASDLIGEACLAVKLGATVEDVASTIHPHPTLNEAFQEAAEAAIGQAIHILTARKALRMLVRALGLKDYDSTWRLQRELVAARLRREIPDTLLLVEHPPVYTCGVSSKAVAPGPLPHPYHVVERGGDFTYHGPGQLVGYPILHLGERGLTARSYLRALEAVLIEALRPFDLNAETLRGFTGVWCRRRKLASIGIAVKGEVSYHGFALNVACDLAPFAAIFPCNLEPSQMATMESLLGRRLDFDLVLRAVAETFLACFDASQTLTKFITNP